MSAKRIIFYSWQSDLPNNTNRTFIEDALKKTVEDIKKDEEVGVYPVVDRDTEGVAGSPEISSTIFAKISAADIFVADVSIVCKQEEGKRRSIPNPNVLIELGYAMKALGYEKIILLFNEAYGEIGEIPFDLRTRRIITYNVSDKTKNKSDEKNKLKDKLKFAVGEALKDKQLLKKKENNNDADNKKLLEDALNSVENNLSNKIIRVRKFLDNFLSRVIALDPKRRGGERTIEDIDLAIKSSQNLVKEFSELSEVVSIMDDKKVASEIIKMFGSLLEKYDIPKGFSGVSYKADFDYFKFIGHELFTTFIAFALKEEKWELIKTILSDPISVSNHYREKFVNVGYISSYPYLIEEDGKNRRRISAQADKLKERHTEGGLAQVLPFEYFISADFFLYIYTKITDREGKHFPWYPRSVVYMKELPLFFVNAFKYSVAKEMAGVVGLKDTSELKERMESMLQDINGLVVGGFWSSSIEKSDIEKIGSM